MMCDANGIEEIFRHLDLVGTAACEKVLLCEPIDVNRTRTPPYYAQRDAWQLVSFFIHYVPLLPA